MKDLTYNQFGRLTALKLHEIKRYKSLKNTQTKAYWLCVCMCGKEKVVRGEHLTSGRTTSCGCSYFGINLKHGHSRRSGNSLTYTSWVQMKKRILNPDTHHAKYYSNIKLDPRWLDFENFLEDMGERPKGTSLDRINNKGNYELENCRWATHTQQMNNTRRQYV